MVRALAWFAGLSTLAVVVLIVLGIIFWHYVAIAAIWWWIGKRYRRRHIE
jgi:hypothetical protein